MPRQNSGDAVAQRTVERLAEQRRIRQEAAQRGVETRRRNREAEIELQRNQEAQDEARAAEHPAQPQEQQAGAQAGAENPTEGHVARQARQRVHADLLTVAIRGHFATRMRALAESTGMSLAKLLKDALLVYEGQMEGGYEPGTSLASWSEPAAE